MVRIHFVTDILPLFRPGDVTCMRRHRVMLDDAIWMTDPAGDGTYPDHANARLVYDQIAGDYMPPDKAWPADRKALYTSWMESGFQP